MGPGARVYIIPKKAKSQAELAAGPQEVQITPLLRPLRRVRAFVLLGQLATQLRECIDGRLFCRLADNRTGLARRIRPFGSVAIKELDVAHRKLEAGIAKCCSNQSGGGVHPSIAMVYDIAVTLR